MAEERLDKTFDVLVENEVIELVLPDNIKQNLRYEARPYQIEAFARFTYYLNKYKHRRKPSQLFSHGNRKRKNLDYGRCNCGALQNGLPQFYFLCKHRYHNS